MNKERVDFVTTGTCGPLMKTYELIHLTPTEAIEANDWMMTIDF